MKGWVVRWSGGLAMEGWIVNGWMAKWKGGWLNGGRWLD